MTILKLSAVDAVRPSARAQVLVFEDPRSQELLRLIERIANSHATVLVTGETGTGKEIVARHLHALSPRHAGPFVAVNCGAFSETLVESELFGHERGSFTGATATRAGWFEAAQGGTLFLDEIGDLPLPVQVKLLRVLQEREVVRVGSRQAQAIDVRLVAATNVHLAAAVAAGRFREDLYYRLNVAAVALPALRERPGDVLPLARYFLDMYSHRLATGAVFLSREAEAALVSHDWPGNIRELENVIHRALLVVQGNELTAADLRLGARTVQPAPVSADGRLDALTRAFIGMFERSEDGLFQTIEETLIRTAYEFCDRNQVQTARLLGISRNVVRARLIQYGEISASPSRPPPPLLASDELIDQP
jgi:sigma-54-specific transcriptional regulator